MELRHYLHSPLEKSRVERVMQYFKVRTTECFVDYYPCNSKRDCDNYHVYNWVELFVSMYNNTIVAKNNPVLTKGYDNILSYQSPFSYYTVRNSEV